MINCIATEVGPSPSKKKNSLYIYIYIYVNHIIHCKIKRDNQQVPKIVRVPGNKTNPKKR